MDRPGNDNTKWIKPNKERQISYDIAYMQNLREKKRYKWTYLQNINRPTDTQKKLGLLKGKQGEDNLGVWD